MRVNMPLEWRLAWRNVWRNPRRTALTVAATVFAVALVVFAAALSEGMWSKIIDVNLKGPFELCKKACHVPVSYTNLTLPTILLV